MDPDYGRAEGSHTTSRSSQPCSPAYRITRGVQSATPSPLDRDRAGPWAGRKPSNLTPKAQQRARSCSRLPSWASIGWGSRITPRPFDVHGNSPQRWCSILLRRLAFVVDVPDSPGEVRCERVKAVQREVVSQFAVDSPAVPSQCSSRYSAAQTSVADVPAGAYSLPGRSLRTGPAPKHAPKLCS
jgi:hypothetical protein